MASAALDGARRAPYLRAMLDTKLINQVEEEVAQSLGMSDPLLKRNGLFISVVLTGNSLVL